MRSRWIPIAAVMTLVVIGSAYTDSPDESAQRGRSTCLGRVVTISGTGGDDVIRGTKGDDVIAAGAGNDRVSGGAGNDIICGGKGDDVLTGGPGADRLQGDSGNDRLDGGKGADEMSGGLGDDVLRGRTGDDRIYGSNGSDRLDGGQGTDLLEGGYGNDTLVGNGGWDTLVGGSGNDRSYGGTGLDRCATEIRFACEETALSPGATGPAVIRLQSRLAQSGLYRASINGKFGPYTEAAVIAFHKATDQKRDSSWSMNDWYRLDGFDPAPPRSRPGQPDRIEVDLSRQILYLILDGEVAQILPVSSGGGYVYERYDGSMVYAATPRGSFRLFRYQPGWTDTYLGGIYNAWSFTSAYAIHGSRSVPAWPVSHGCVRVPTWDADWLSSRLWIGLDVHIWG